MKTSAFTFSSFLVSTTLLPSSCTVNYDMVTFAPKGLMPATKTPIPKIEIDTNVSAGMMGGDVKSKSPYDIQVHYLDDSFTFTSAEFTKVIVTYADGTIDPGVAALKLPMSFQNRIHVDFVSAC